MLRELQVTRAGCSAVQVGMNTLTHVFEADTSDSSDVLEVLSLFEVPEKERIVVSAGDIVGLVVELGQNCESSKVWISGREVNNVLYRLLTHESSLLHVLSTSCGSFERDRHLSPCVAAVVGKKK